jgi:hypothetical protein
VKEKAEPIISSELRSRINLQQQFVLGRQMTVRLRDMRRFPAD